ncbi:MAG: enoyl-CoA hydratase-related protein [Syntrophales bacterium]|jgi:enoyl-CoA hydratase/carnithine racemase|nr:enoyl-CoA hydratase-related protein [Syntrophales bacterium]
MVARITINQAEEMNRLNHALLKEIARVARSADNDNNARVLIISGAGGKAYCAGAELKEI